jgi:hypothetical protein
MLTQACKAIKTLAWDDFNIRSRLGAAGACEAIVTVLKAYSKNSPIVIEQVIIETHPPCKFQFQFQLFNFNYKWNQFILGFDNLIQPYLLRFNFYI